MIRGVLASEVWFNTGSKRSKAMDVSVDAALPNCVSIFGVDDGIVETRGQDRGASIVAKF